MRKWEALKINTHDLKVYVARFGSFSLTDLYQTKYDTKIKNALRLVIDHEKNQWQLAKFC